MPIPRAVFGTPLAIALSVAVVLPATAPATAAPSTAAPAGKLLYAPPGQAIDDSFIVVLKANRLGRSTVDATARRLTASLKGRVNRVYSSALDGFEASLDEAAARKLAADPEVAYVEQNRAMRLQDVQTNPTWGLDRIDQRTHNRDNTYTYPTYASDVQVYVIDTGIQASNVEFFWGRVTPGASMLEGQYADQDCHGHGTHVAGTIGGTTYGVAKGVTLIPVKVTNCVGNLSAATVLAGVDWVTAHHQPGERAIANMSLTGPPTASIDDAVVRSMNDGVVYTAAAGTRTDFNSDACQLTPARIPGVVTVASMGNTDLIDGSSNTGPCVDVYAPGIGIVSAYHLYDFGTTVMDGTSMASAHAAGVAAMLWSLHPTHSAAAISRLVRQTAHHGAGWHPNSKPDPALNVQQVVPSALPAVDGILVGIPATQLTVAGGTAPYTWSATGLPIGVTLTPAGMLSGRVANGAHTVTVTVRDSTGRTGTVTELWRSRPVCLATETFC